MNILCIVTDDLAASAFNAHGMPRSHTISASLGSTLGHLVQQNCVPTRACFMTGLEPHKIGLHGTHSIHSLNAVPANNEMISERFRDAGYRTGCFGKWHLGPEPHQSPFSRGFTHGLGFENGHQNPWPQKEDGSKWDSDDTNGHDHGNINDGGIDLAINYDGLEGVSRIGLNQTDYTSCGAQRFMRDAVASGEPFFAYVAFGAPHAPISAPARYLSRALNRYPLTKAQYDMIDWHGDVAGLTALSARRKGVSDEDLAAIMKTLYLGCIYQLDDAIHDLVYAVDAIGAMEDTTILFFNDNGAGADQPLDNDDYRGFKGSVWQGAHQTPNFIIHPDVRAGDRDRGFVWVGDWYNTLLGFAGLPLKDGLDGRDLSGWLSGFEELPRFPDGDFSAIIHVENTYKPEKDIRSKAIAFVTGIEGIEWKYFIKDVNGRKREALFNLSRDPKEQNNLYSNNLGRVIDPVYQAAYNRHKSKFERAGGWNIFDEIAVIQVEPQSVPTPQYWTAENPQIHTDVLV